MIFPGIIIGLSFHEFAHAFVAYKLGDMTPKLQGRVTISPLAHIDPIGMIALIFIGFGWGIPVQINPRNFKKPRRDEFLVAIAGVTTNFILAFIFMGVVRLFTSFGAELASSSLGGTIVEVLLYVVQINLILMVFNLLPIPPLDGFNIIGEVFNLKRREWYYKTYDKGMIILLVLIILGLVERVLLPAVNFFYQLLFGIFF
jgi:Zn-dependent protease